MQAACIYVIGKEFKTPITRSSSHPTIVQLFVSFFPSFSFQLTLLDNKALQPPLREKQTDWITQLTVEQQLNSEHDIIKVMQTLHFCLQFEAGLVWDVNSETLSKWSREIFSAAEFN